MEHASFDPAPVTRCNMPQTPPRPVCRCLSFSTPQYSEDEEEEEDFQMVPLYDEHWTSEEIPEIT